ncbi:glyoxalase [Pelagibius litoralis]|uniref:Glyoxalase n=1 Tax=Pelagibius litoralis TaxID=374515 RepID=A0A967EV18_9PROT|nr:VOC family protein [Pelagibius litoralis]NIA67174.1 glyoxalase [Pelagibius litoralis]
MALAKLDHVNIRTASLAPMIAFYETVLGFTAGARPPFGFPGAWLYCGDTAVVHLIEVGNAPEPGGDLRLEHFAFSASGLADFLSQLRGQDCDYQIGVVPDFGIIQVNIHDPDGNHIHVDFAPAEAASVSDEPALAAV